MSSVKSWLIGPAGVLVIWAMANGALADAAAQAPTAKPYLFEARRDGSSVVLSGQVPSPSARADIVAAAKASVRGIEVVDRLSVGEGAPAEFVAIAVHGVTQAGKLFGGTVSLADKGYSIAGATWTSAAYEAAMAATRSLPGGATLARADISPPEAKPYVLKATSDGKTVRLEGSAPSLELRDTLAARAVAVLPRAEVINRLGIARGVPDGDFAGAASFAFDELAKLASGTAVLKDGQLSISGTGREEVSGETIADDAKAGLPHGFALAMNGVVAAPAHPFAFTAEKTAQGIALGGHAPTAAVRDTIMAAAKAAAGPAPVTGRLRIASGLPAGVDHAAGAELLLTALGGLVSGKASLSDGTLAISGEAAEEKGVETVRAALQGLPAGLSAGTTEIRQAVVTPYVLTAQAGRGEVSLSGHFPDDATHEEILAVTRRQFFGVRVVDDLVRGPGAPAGFRTAASAMLAGLSRLASGTGVMSDTAIRLKGDAYYEKAAASIPAELSAAVPPGYAATAAVAVAAVGPPVAAGECQPLFADILGRGQIRFDTGSASIAKDSAAVLDNLVAVAMRCPAAELEVAGHTDAVGEDGSNQELSRQRAQAVADYLVMAGVESGRLSVAGHGSEQPVASNDTEAGRAQNRRIEFRVK